MSALYLYLLGRTPKTSLTLELRADVDGEPRGTLVATAPVEVSTLVENTFTWVPTPLAEPVAIEVNARIWIVLRADVGEVEWRRSDIPADGSAALFSTDRGNTWQTHPLAASYVFQRLLPDPTTPLTLQIQVGGEEQEIVYTADSTPLSLESEAPLVQGMNRIIIIESGATLPSTVDLTLHTDSAMPVQVTLTQFDIAYTQVFSEEV